MASPSLVVKTNKFRSKSKLFGFGEDVKDFESFRSMVRSTLSEGEINDDGSDMQTVMYRLQGDNDAVYPIKNQQQYEEMIRYKDLGRIASFSVMMNKGVHENSEDVNKFRSAVEEISSNFPCFQVGNDGRK